MKSVYIFGDHSNLHWEGVKCGFNPKKFIREVEKGYEGCIQKRFLVGSSPVGDKDPMFKDWKDARYRVVAHKKKKKEKEQGVDSQLVAEMQKTMFDNMFDKPASIHTLIVYSGDGNDNDGCASIFDAVRRAVRIGWNVTIYSWQKCCNRNYHTSEFAEAKKQGRYRVVYVDYLDVFGDEIVVPTPVPSPVQRKILTCKACIQAMLDVLQSSFSFETFMKDIRRLKPRMGGKNVSKNFRKCLLATLAKAGDPTLLAMVEEEASEYKLRGVVNQQCDGYGPLSRALFEGHWEVASILLKMGANPRLKNRLGESADEVIDNGERAMLQKKPALQDVTRERFERCRGIITRWRFDDSEEDDVSEEESNVSGEETNDSDGSLSVLDSKIKALESEIYRLERNFRAHTERRRGGMQAR